ncbi:MAG: acyl-protein synthetase [Waddliaceae bacterium]
MEIDVIKKHSPYEPDQEAKKALLLEELNALTQHHADKCKDYARIIHLFYKGKTKYQNLGDLPYLPVTLFKERLLSSIPENEIFKTLLSSGTTGALPSRVILDRKTAAMQSAALTQIITSYIGNKRLPMIIVDHSDVIRDRHLFGARGAAILGMLPFGRDHFYALSSSMELRIDPLRQWLKTHRDEKILIFGLTYLVWEHLLNASHSLPIPQGILFHTGGWKKLQERRIGNREFTLLSETKLHTQQCYNFYSMVEQLGSVFMECEEGVLHTPFFADAIVRDPESWQETEIGKEGVLQLLSLLPLSYPGHSILTEDLGILHGVDECPCGRKGKYFSVIGRVPQAEPRGCSDTYSI